MARPGSGRHGNPGWFPWLPYRKIVQPIFSARAAFPAFRWWASPCEERPIRPARSSRQARGSRWLRDGPLRRRLDMGRIQRQPGEREAADEIADYGRDFVPDQIVHQGELGAEQQAGREQEHVYDRVLEGHE